MNKDVNNDAVNIEPRVARLETGLEMLTREVGQLSSVVKEQGRSIEDGMRKLSIDVTSALGPRKTDWSVIFAGLSLVIIICSAVFFPLNRSVSEIKDQIKYEQELMASHARLDMHPVGGALIVKLENELRLHTLFDDRQFSDLDKKIQREVDYLSKFFTEKIEGARKEHEFIRSNTMDNKK